MVTTVWSTKAIWIEFVMFWRLSQLHYNISSWFGDRGSVWYTTMWYSTCHLCIQGWMTVTDVYGRLCHSCHVLGLSFVLSCIKIVIQVRVCVLLCISCCWRLTLFIVWHCFYNSLLSLAYSMVVFKVTVTIWGCLWFYLALKLWFEFMEVSAGYTATMMQIELKHFVFGTWYCCCFKVTCWVRV
jgi:hypothetical protein